MTKNSGAKPFIAPIACIVLMLSGLHGALADAVAVFLHLPVGAAPDTYWKYGPVPGAPTPH